MQQEGAWKANGPDAERALGILDGQKDYKVDDKRSYLTGLSMGGIGTWSLPRPIPTRGRRSPPSAAAATRPGREDQGPPLLVLPRRRRHGRARAEVART